MRERRDTVWQSSIVVEKYLNDVRRAVPLAAEQIEVMLRLIEARGEPVTNFIDLGCGDGILAGVILEQYPTAQGLLVDFSEPMIQTAREKLNRFDPNLTFMLGDYSHAGWLDAAIQQSPFDIIVSGYSIHHQPDVRKQSLYEEIYALLRPGGLFVNIEHVASPTKWVESVWNNCFIDGLYTVSLEQGKPKSREQITQEYFDSTERAANILAPVEVQCAWLRRLGFIDVDCYFKIFELAVFGGRRPA